MNPLDDSVYVEDRWLDPAILTCGVFLDCHIYWEPTRIDGLMPQHYGSVLFLGCPSYSLIAHERSRNLDRTSPG